MNEEILFENEIPEENEEVVVSTKNLKIENFIGKANIMSLLSEDKINCIYSQVAEGYERDCSTREARNNTLKEANKIAMQVVGNKSTPWEGCANVKLPLITTSAIDFASKIYPAVIQDDEVVRCKIVAKDNEDDKFARMKAGERLSNYLNYQLTEKIPNWKENMDILTYALPVNGIMIKKVYYDVLENCYCSDLIFPENFFTPNDTREIDTSERVTHVYQMSTEDIISYLRFKVFSGFSSDDLKDNILLNQGDGGTDNEIVRDEDKNYLMEESNVFTICEQHCWLDLDEDGYREPYIVTFIPKLNKIVRISARYDEKSIITNEDNEIVKIKPIPCFTKYSFLQSPDGSFYSLGLGELLLPINEAANTVTNQLLDAGTLNNLPAGWISKTAKMSAGDMALAPGEFKQVNSFMGKIQDSIMLLPTKEPSVTLFELLKTLMASAEDIASVKALTNTDFPSNSSVITTLSIIENGMSPFKAIYKRFHAALTKEIKLLSSLIDRYFDISDYRKISGPKASYMDFQTIDTIIPVSDPSLVTSTQKMGRAQFLAELLNNPVFDPVKVSIEMVSLMGIDPTPLLAQPQQPDAYSQELALAQLENVKAQTEETKSRTRKNIVQSQAELIRANSEDTKRNADSILALANAEEKESGLQNPKHIKELKEAKENSAEVVENKLGLDKINN